MTVGRFLRATVLGGVGLTLAAVAVAAALAPGDVVAGVAVGGGLGAVNLSAIGWLCHRAVTVPGRRAWYLAAIGLKFAVLIAAIFAVMRWVPMDALGFLGGLSAPFVAIVGAATWMAVRKVELET